MIISFQVIATRQGDKIYTLDDEGVLRVKQPQQMWREIPTSTELPEPQRSEYRTIAPLRSASQIHERSSILDGYIL
jgi:hypothetical protein